MRRKLLSLVLAFVMLCALTVPASAANSDFVVKNGVLVEYKGSATAVTIPSNLGIKEIGAFAFKKPDATTKLTKVVVPEGVTKLGESAFDGCYELVEISLPSTLREIGEMAFWGCTALPAIDIPEGVTTVGNYAFQECRSLDDITVPASVTYIGTGAFQNCPWGAGFYCEENSYAYDWVMKYGEDNFIIISHAGKEEPKPVGYSPEDFVNSSWFGTYVGAVQHKQNGRVVGEDLYDRYIDLTINTCDRNGNITGLAKITTVEGQGASAWVNYNFNGKIDLEKGTFYMKGTTIISLDSGSNSWTLCPFSADILTDENGEMRLSGWFYKEEYGETRAFNAARTSAWAKSEMTEANILGLIPEALKGADMSRRITRGEFAAVAVELYESLSGTSAPVVATPFTDISGNSNRESIAKAYGLGLANGVSATEFAPNQQITREQLATMLSRAVKKYSFPEWTLETDWAYQPDTSAVARFSDDWAISDFAKPSVYYMVQLGILKGVDGNRFAPKNTTTEEEARGYATATREQAVALSLRIYKLLDSWR